MTCCVHGVQYTEDGKCPESSIEERVRIATLLYPEKPADLNSSDHKSDNSAPTGNSTDLNSGEARDGFWSHPSRPTDVEG